MKLLFIKNYSKVKKNVVLNERMRVVMYYFERKMDEREVKSSTKNVGVGFSVLLLGGVGYENQNK